jgi:hypothetical protein
MPVMRGLRTNENGKKFYVREFKESDLEILECFASRFKEQVDGQID